MNPETFRTLRKRARLTQSGLAALWGIHRATVGRWESGDIEIPVWAARLIERELMTVPPR
jgi:DNA-binding transcriptional regulator YiaG